MTWRPNAREAAIASRVFAEFADNGLSFSAIAKLLNTEGVPARKGGRWAPRVVAQLLKSRHVLGEFRGGGEWHEGDFDAVVDRDLWERAQRLLDRNAKYRPKGSSGRLPKSHLFVRGTLRCGKCGEAMLPRSRESKEWYVCRTRAETGGSEACATPVLKRALVDETALFMFERSFFDVEATRAHIAEQLDERVRFARGEADRAASEVVAAAAQLERIDRDYESRDLGPKGYERQLAKHTEALAAAQAEREPLAAHADALGASIDGLDVESEALRRLHALREAVAGRVRSTNGDLDALRAALAAVFAATTVIYHEADRSSCSRLSLTPRSNSTRTAASYRSAKRSSASRSA